MGKLISLHENNTNRYTYESDLELIRNNLFTEKARFKFPTILSRYRKNINAVKSIHNFLQESIIKRDTEDFTPHHEWCLNLLSNSLFIDHVIEALSHDIHQYKCLLRKYKNTLCKSELFDLSQIISKLSYMKDSFELFKVLSSDQIDFNFPR